MTSQKLIVGLKLSITGTLLAWLTYKYDVREIVAILSSISITTVAIAAILHTGVFLLSAWRWWRLFQYADDKKHKLASVLPSYYVGVFFNNLLPSSMGGDVVRTVRLARLGMRSDALLGSAVIDRVIGFVAVLMVAGSGLLFSGNEILPGAYRTAAILTAAGALAIFAGLFSTHLYGLLDRTAEKWRGKILRFFVETIKVCHRYRFARYQLFVATLLAVAAQCVVVLVYYLIGRGLDMHLPVAVYFTVVPLAFLAGCLPASLGGLGVREGAAVTLLIGAGADGGTAAALAFAYLGILWATSLPGGVIILLRPLWRRSWLA